MAKIKLIGIGGSRAARVIWMLAELGLEYEHDPISFADPRLKLSPYIELNPNGRIPSLVHDGHVITESLAINLYLAQKYPGALSAKTVEEQGTIDQWTCWAMSDLDLQVGVWTLHSFIKPPAERDTALAASTFAQLQRPLSVLNSALSNRPYLLGNRFTVADLNIASVLYRALQWELADQPNLKRWLHDVWQRPAALVSRRARGEKI